MTRSINIPQAILLGVSAGVGVHIGTSLGKHYRIPSVSDPKIGETLQIKESHPNFEDPRWTFKVKGKRGQMLDVEPSHPDFKHWSITELRHQGCPQNTGKAIDNELFTRYSLWLHKENFTRCKLKLNVAKACSSFNELMNYR